MSGFRFHRPSLCLPMVIVVMGLSWAVIASAQSVTWQILPWPDDQNWLGPRGNPAVTNGNQVTLTGQDVRTVQSFTGPSTISFDVSMQAKITPDGGFHLQFVPTGEPVNLLANPNIDLQMNWGNLTLGDTLGVQQNNGSYLWGLNPFTFSAGTVYHYSVTVAGNGQIGWSINGADVGLSNSIVLPFSNYQLRLVSWQPTAVWQVSNFTVVPEPATVTLVGVSLVALLITTRRRNSASR